MRYRLSIAVLVAVLLVAFGLYGRANSRADPVLRQATIALPDWPPGAAPVRVLLISDIHFGNASTAAPRLRRIIASAIRLQPDLVLFAGDFVAGYEAAAAVAHARALTPLLAPLRPPLGKVAVLGNHDNETAPREIARALRAAGVTVVENSAIRRGPLLIGGSGDTVSGHAKLGGTLNALRRLEARAPGARLYMSHAPDLVHWLPPGPALLLTGHTHCGQVVLPLIGPVVPVSTVHGDRYRCGLIRSAGKTVVVTGGLGTSTVPFRLGAAPDMWLLTLGPTAPNAA